MEARPVRPRLRLAAPAASALLALLVGAALAAVATGASPAAGVSAGARAVGTFAWPQPLALGEPSGVVTRVVPGPNGTVYTVAEDGASWSGVARGAIAVTRVRASDGHVVWRRTYAGPGTWATPSSIVAMPNGDVVVLGRQRPDEESGTSWVVLRYKKGDGELRWTVTRSSPDAGGRPTDCEAYGLAVDGAGGVYVAGRTGTNSTTPGVATAVKYDAGGHEVWLRALPSFDGGILNGVAVDEARNSYVTGCIVIDADAPTVALGVVVRLNPDGRVAWSQPIGKSGFFQTAGPLVRGKSLYVRGLRWVPVEGAATQGWPFVAKVSLATGRRAWVTTLKHIPGSMQQPQGFAVDKDGNAFICGGSQGVDVAEMPEVTYMGWIYKLRSAGGTELWHRWVVNDTGPVAYQGWASDVAVDGAGRAYVAEGWDPDGSDTGSEAVVVRYNAGGGVQKRWLMPGEATGWGNDCRTVAVIGGKVFAGGGLETQAGQLGFLQSLVP